MKTLFDEDLTLEEAKELIRNGADVNRIDVRGATPLFYADKIEIAKLLIDHGADVNLRDNDKATPLFYTINPLHNDKNAAIALSKLLIDNGADVNAQNKDGHTPLHLTDDIKIIDLLTKNEANVNIKDARGYIPLHYILKYSNKENAEILIQAGSDLNMRIKKGSLVSTLSYLINCTDINGEDINIKAKLLIKYGAVFSEIMTYKVWRHLFTKEQQKNKRQK
jgi:ankyrin repeat protein